jgi:hypothetical protein
MGVVEVWGLGERRLARLFSFDQNAHKFVALDYQSRVTIPQSGGTEGKVGHLGFDEPTPPQRQPIRKLRGHRAPRATRRTIPGAKKLWNISAFGDLDCFTTNIRPTSRTSPSGPDPDSPSQQPPNHSQWPPRSPSPTLSRSVPRSARLAMSEMFDGKDSD